MWHDFFRDSGYHDPKHGKKALYALDSVKQDKTVQICLDSDKLDLGKMGVQPEEKYLLTPEAKQYLKENL